MKAVNKKIHCNSCQKLVKGLEQDVNGNRRVVCPRCERVLWVWNGLTWKYTPEET